MSHLHRLPIVQFHLDLVEDAIAEKDLRRARRLLGTAKKVVRLYAYGGTAYWDVWGHDCVDWARVKYRWRHLRHEVYCHMCKNWHALDNIPASTEKYPL